VVQKQEVIPALGHNTQVVKGKAATCTESGLTDGKTCTVCKKVVLAQQTLPALGHSTVNQAAIPATCTESGMTAGSYCASCGDVLIARAEVPALGHTIVSSSAVAPTCTKTGLTANSSCSVCHTVFAVQEEIPALGHSDADGDANCDVCGQFDAMAYLRKFSKEGSYTENSVTDGEKVLGNVYRIYRPTEENPGYGYSAYGLTNSPPFIGAYIATDTENYDNPFYAVGCTPENVTVDGDFAYIVYEDYIDFYLGESTLTRRANDSITEHTAVINNETTLSMSSFGSEDAVFRLTLN
jgi:hypothetical protein